MTINFIIGSGRYRIELQASRYSIWYRIPFIGQGHWSKEGFGGWAIDDWKTIKDDGTGAW
jgi:hypothetical protein